MEPTSSSRTSATGGAQSAATVSRYRSAGRIPQVGSAGRRRNGRIGTVLRSAAAHRLPALAAESAFFAALAVVPVLLTVVAVLSAVRSVLGPEADAAAAQV